MTQDTEFTQEEIDAILEESDKIRALYANPASVEEIVRHGRYSKAFLWVIWISLFYGTAIGLFCGIVIWGNSFL